MNVTNDGGSVDILEYVTKQFPKDVKAMLDVRDELAKRQGAISAIKDAEKDRDKAAQELEKASIIAAKAEEKQRFVTDAETAVKAAETSLNARINEFTAKSVETEKMLAARQANLEAREKFVAEQDAALKDALAKLEAYRSALETRIKAFQDKVAALNV